jgi:predicted nucleic acid-binding protein
MTVLVDTPIWSLVFRRRADRLSAHERQHVEEWTALVQQRRVLLVGPVRQEVLSGIRDGRAFDRLRLALRAFPDEALAVEDFEEAARAGNVCRAAGVAGSTVDYLLCGAALRRDAAIYTTDRDFGAYARHLPLRLHHPGT